MNAVHSSPNLYFPLNHRQRTCLTLCKEDARCTSHPGAECAYTNQKTHAGSTLFQQPTVPQCEGAFRVEMGLKKKCLSIKSFTADHNGCIQNSTFFSSTMPRNWVLLCISPTCVFGPHSIIYRSEYFTWTDWTRDWNMLTAFKCDVMMRLILLL